MWRVYLYEVNSVGQVVQTNRTEETFEFPEDAIPFQTLVLFRNRGWVLAPFYSPNYDGNTVYFCREDDDKPCCELRREN